MRVELKELEAGNKVWCGCYSGHGSEGIEKVEKTIDRFDPKTGEKYKVIVLSGNRKFDSRTSSALNSPSAYFLKPTEQ